MESKPPSRVIPLDYIRGLVVTQGGRCAITGLPLDPQEVNADHITPLSRKELSPTGGPENVWLVHKKVNAMKGSMSYDELVQMARTIVDHAEASRSLLSKIRANAVKPVSKKDFDIWVQNNCNEVGVIKT